VNLENEREKGDEKENQELRAPGPQLARRLFVGATALAGAGFLGKEALAQTHARNCSKAEPANSASDPGPENKTLLHANASSNRPPFTDHGKSRAHLVLV
jgi:hypothetical protein